MPSNNLCALLNCGLGAFGPVQTPFSFLCKLASDFLPAVTSNSILLSRFAGFSFSLSPPPLSVCVSNDVSLVTLACFFPNCILLFFSSPHSHLTKPVLLCLLRSLSYSTASFLFNSPPASAFPPAWLTPSPTLCPPLAPFCVCSDGL